MDEVTKEIKVVIIGEVGVGKTCLATRFTLDKFKLDNDTTIGATYMNKTIKYDNEIVMINIWDTAGQERFHSVAHMYFRNTTAIILVYDVTYRPSFEALGSWMDEITEKGPESPIIVVVGNKEDLVDTEEVSADEGRVYAESIGASYFRVSALNSNGIDSLFLAIAQKAPKLEDTQRVVINSSVRPQKRKSKCCK